VSDSDRIGHTAGIKKSAKGRNGGYREAERGGSKLHFQRKMLPSTLAQSDSIIQRVGSSVSTPVKNSSAEPAFQQ